MIRQTSIDVYRQIKAEGLLSKRRLEVFKAIVCTAPCTSAEALQSIHTGSHGIGSRFSELRELGVIKEIGVRKCTVTNRNVIEWDLTDNLPEGKIAKKGSKKPKNFKASIDYIIKNMLSNGEMFVTEIELKEMN